MLVVLCKTISFAVKLAANICTILGPLATHTVSTVATATATVAAASTTTATEIAAGFASVSIFISVSVLWALIE